jgi:hypothetical protein
MKYLVFAILSSITATLVQANLGEVHSYEVRVTRLAADGSSTPIVGKTVAVTEWKEDITWFGTGTTNQVHSGSKTDAEGRAGVAYKEGKHHRGDQILCVKIEGPYYCVVLRGSNAGEESCRGSIGNGSRACKEGEEKYACDFSLQTASTVFPARYEVTCRSK